jgi:hypothetical protein
MRSEERFLGDGLEENSEDDFYSLDTYNQWVA